MNRLELLIQMVRDLSQNSRYDDDSGLSQRVMTQYFKNAQDSLMKAVSTSKCKYLLKTAPVFQVSSGQQFVDYPKDLFLRNIDTVEWNLSGNNGNEGWIQLYKSISKDRYSARIGYPMGYILQEKQMVLTPPIENGFMRITYNRRPRDPQIRMGRITAVTVVSDQITAITIDQNEESFNSQALNASEVMCIVARDGSTKVDGVKFDSVSVSGVFTMSPYTLTDGESVSVGDFVCAGSFVTNLPEWPDIVESYLIKWAVFEAKYGDSSQWTKTAIEDVARSQQELIQAFALMSDDVTDVPILNSDYLDIW